MEGGDVNHLQRISKLTALTSLEIEDDDHVASVSRSAFQQLHKLCKLKMNCYDVVTFAEAPFTNLVDLDLSGCASFTCNVESCVRLTRLVLYGAEPNVGLTQLILPSGPSVHLRELYLSNSTYQPEGDYQVANLHLASQLRSLTLELVCPKWVTGWPRCLPALANLKADEVPNIRLPFHSLSKYSMLTSLIWYDLDVNLLDGLSRLTQLNSLSLNRVHNANASTFLTQVMALTQLSSLTLYSEHIAKLALTIDVFQFATWPLLQYLCVNDGNRDSGYSLDEQLHLDKLQDMLTTANIECDIIVHGE